MKNLLKQRIKGAIQDLHDFHQNTFDYEECEWLKDREDLKVKEFLNQYKDRAIDDGRELDRQRAEGLLAELDGLSIEIGLSYEDLDELTQDGYFDWNFDDIEVHLYNEDENPRDELSVENTQVYDNERP